MADHHPTSAEAALAAAAARPRPVDLAAHAAAVGPRLAACLRRLAARAGAWVAASCASKGIDPSAATAAEEIASGPVAAARALQVWRRALAEVATGRPPSLVGRVQHDAAACRVRALPALPFDRLAFAGHHAEVEVDPALPLQELGAPQRGVALVLGAGNVTSIPVADMLSALCRTASPVVVKLHPLHAELQPLLADVFAPLDDLGCAFVTGDAAAGAALAADARVTHVHVTGAVATFARLAQANAARALPATLSAELGNVTPVVVVPGRYRARELAAAVAQVATMVTNNGSFNCVAARVLVTARAWPQRQEFLARLRAALAAIPPRHAFQAGAAARWAAASGRTPDDPLHLPWHVVAGIDPGADHPAFAAEVFAPVLCETALGVDDARAFLRAAVAFCNDRLFGDLAAHLLVDRATRRRLGPDLEEARGSLRYGTVATNTWAALAFAWMATPWGAAPGNTPRAPGSGIGFVHDPLFLRAPRKVLVRGPLAPWPTPPWWPAHRTPVRTMQRMLDLTLAPGCVRAAALVAAAVRGGWTPPG